MRALATLFLLLGAADLAALNLVIGPAVLGERGRATAESRARGIRLAVIEPAAAIESPTTSSARAADPIAGERGRGSGDGIRTDPASAPTPAPVRPPAARPVASSDAVADPAPDAVAEPVPDPEPVPAPAPGDPAADPDRDAEHADSLPRPVTLHFGLDRDDLGRSSRAKLDRVADILDDRPALEAVIDGHADESGSGEHNQDLSERRAQAVAEYLQERGIPATRLTVRGFGELNPLTADSERSRKNRRVEIRFDSRAVKGDTE